MILLSTKNYQRWLISVEDIARQSRHSIQHEKLKIPNFWCSCFPSCAEMSVMRSRLTNNHLIAYSLSNISAKNHQNWLMCVECATSMSFILRHSVYVRNATAEFTKFLVRVDCGHCSVLTWWRCDVLPHNGTSHHGMYC